MSLTIEKKLEKLRKDFYVRLYKVIPADIIEMGKELDLVRAANDAKQINEKIKLLHGKINDTNNIQTNMELYYHISNLYSSLRKICEESEFDFYYEKEIFYLRKLLNLFESNFPLIKEGEADDHTFIANYIAMRSYTNLANSLRAVGRYISAIDGYHDALLLSDDFSMASLNLSSALFDYGLLQYRDYEQQYFFHSAYYYYEKTVENKYNLEDESYINFLEEKYINRFTQEFIKDFLQKPLSLPNFEVTDQNEFFYRNYIAGQRLFLEPCLDILSSQPCFLVDSLNLPFEPLKDGMTDEYIGLFNLMKQEYISARYMWYMTTIETYREFCDSFADKQTDLVELEQECIIELRESLLRCAFRMVYSVFDKVGFFINQYFNIGLPRQRVSFKNIWKDEVLDQNGKNLIKNPIHLQPNVMLQSIFWLQKDLYEHKNVSTTNPEAIKMFKMRNDMEHNCLRTVLKIPTQKTLFTTYTTPYTIGDYTERLLRLARECLIYLVLAVNIAEKQKSEL